MAKPKPPIYVLPHGIEVVGEYPPNRRCKYWMCRIRPHPFFPGPKVIYGGVYVMRNRVVMAAHLGRALSKDEHVHHGALGRAVDTIDKLTLMSADDHRRHHAAESTGRNLDSSHKAKIGAGMRRAIAEGRRKPPPHQDWTGRKHSDASKEKIRAAALARHSGDVR